MDYFKKKNCSSRNMQAIKKVESQLLQKKLHFKSNNKKKLNSSSLSTLLPPTNNFEHFKLKITKLPDNCKITILYNLDFKALVSIACLDKFDYNLVKQFANKLPLMCLNVSRLTYTAKIFKFFNFNRISIFNSDNFFQNNSGFFENYNEFKDNNDDNDDDDDEDDDDDNNERNKDNVLKAINFYIKWELNNVKKLKLPPNEEFSKLLHNLKLAGSENYIMSLASFFGLHVDLIQEEKTLYFRYINMQNLKCKKTLTVIVVCKKNIYFNDDEREWYVFITNDRLL